MSTPIRESSIKKFGLNDAPRTPRPTQRPGAQRPQKTPRPEPPLPQTPERDLKCSERIDSELKRRVKEIKGILKAEDSIEELNNISLAYTDDPYYRAKRLELSWGGPADGFRFFEDGTIEYYFMDWFDGDKQELYGEDKDILQELYDSCLSY